MKYKNMTNQELVMPSVGVIKPNEEFESPVVIENPNIKLQNDAPAVEEKTDEPKTKTNNPVKG